MAFKEGFKGVDEAAYSIGRPVSVWLEQRAIENTIAGASGLRAVGSAWKRGSSGVTVTPNTGDRPVAGNNSYFWFIPLVRTAGVAGFELDVFLTCRRFNGAGNPTNYFGDITADVFDGKLRKIGTTTITIQPAVDEYQFIRLTVAFDEDYRGAKQYATIGLRCPGLMLLGDNRLVTAVLDLDNMEGADYVQDISSGAPSLETSGPNNLSSDFGYVYPNDGNEGRYPPGTVEVLGFSSGMDKICTTRPIGEMNKTRPGQPEKWTIQQSYFFQVASVSVRVIFGVPDPPNIRQLYPGADEEHRYSSIDAALATLLDRAGAPALGAHGPAGQLPSGTQAALWPDEYAERWPFIRGDEGALATLADFSMNAVNVNPTLEVPLYVIPTIHGYNSLATNELITYTGTYEFRIWVRQLADEEDWGDATTIADVTVSQLSLPTYYTAFGSPYDYLRTQAIMQGGLEGPTGEPQTALFDDACFYAAREGSLFPADLDLLNAYLLVAECENIFPEQPIRVTIQARLTQLSGFTEHDEMNQLRLTCIGWSANEELNRG